MRLKLFTLIVCLIYLGVCSAAANIASINDTISGYLKKPTGQYGVGFEDFHWINQNACPDLNYNGKNQSDFSADNKNNCHEIMVRIYYPAIAQDKQRSFYHL